MASTGTDFGGVVDATDAAALLTGTNKADTMVLDVTGHYGTEIATADYTTLDGGANYDSLTIRLTTSQMEALKLELASQSGVFLNDKGELIGDAQSAFNGNQYTTLDSIGITVKSWESVKFEVSADPILNEAPVAQAKTDAATEGGAVINGSVVATDADDGATLTYSLTGPAPAGLSLNADGSYSFDPTVGAYDHLAKDATTDVVATYQVSDGLGGIDTETLTIKVTGTNDAPVAQAKTDAATEGGAVINGSVVATDADDGATLTYSLTGPAPAGLSLNADGSYSFDPTVGAYDHLAKDATTDVVATYQVSDGLGGIDTETLTITVTGTNEAPVDIQWNATDWTGGVALPGANVVLANLTTVDPDNDSGFTYSLLAGSSSNFAVSADGTVTRSTGLLSGTTYTLNVQATDSDGASHTETFNIITGTDVSNNLPGGGADDPIVIGDDVIYANAGIKDVIFAGSGDDTVFGQDGEDHVWGGDGNDVLDGGNNFDNLNGEAGNDILRGDVGSDFLNGGDGNDTLTGGSLDDNFVFNTALGDTNVDTITDFTNISGNNDRLALESDVFGGLGPTVTADEIWSGVGAQDANDMLQYNSSDGKLYYDADANGAGEAVQFAQLALGVSLTTSDFFVI